MPVLNSPFTAAPLEMQDRNEVETEGHTNMETKQKNARLLGIDSDLRTDTFLLLPSVSEQTDEVAREHGSSRLTS